MVEDRITLACYSNEADGRLEVENKLASRWMYLSGDAVRGHAWKAAKAGKNEVELEDIAYDNYGFQAKVFLLVDVAEKHGYALKVYLKTTTSSSTSFFLLPQIKKK